MSGKRVAALGALVIGFAASVLAVVVAIEGFPRGLIALGLVWLAVLVGCYGVLRRGAARVAGLSAAAVAFAAAILVLLDERVVEIALVVGGLRGRLRPWPGGGNRAPATHVRRSAPTPRPDLQSQVGRRQGGEVLARHRGAGARHRGNRARSRPGPREDRPGRRRPRRRRARHGRRRRLAGDRRDDRRRARPSLRVHPVRHAKPLRPRSRGRSRRRRRRARRIRGRRRAPRRSRRGERAGIRQQRLARRLRRGGPAFRLPGREAPHAARHGAGRARARRFGARPALDRAERTGAQRGRRDHGFEQPLPAWTDGRLRNPPCDRRRSARDHGRRRAERPWGGRAIGAAAGAGVDRADVRGPRRWTSFPRESTARRARLEPPLRFGIRTRVLRVRIAPQHPGASPSARLPEGAIDGVRTLGRIAAGYGPASGEPQRKET